MTCKMTIFENIHLWSHFQQVYLTPPQIWSVAKFKALTCIFFFFFLSSDSVLGWFCNFLQMSEEKCKKLQFFTLPENNRGRLMEKRTALGKETNNTFLILNCVNRDKKGNVWCTKRVVGLGHEQFELNIILQKVIVNEYFFILTKQKKLSLNQTHPIYI